MRTVDPLKAERGGRKTSAFFSPSSIFSHSNSEGEEIKKRQGREGKRKDAGEPRSTVEIVEGGDHPRLRAVGGPPRRPEEAPGEPVSSQRQKRCCTSTRHLLLLVLLFFFLLFSPFFWFSFAGSFSHELGFFLFRKKVCFLF